jgi:GT2 family glycosyltransferase
MTRLTAIVVTWNGRELLARCLAVLEPALEAVNGHSEVLVVDNASTDGTAEMVRARFPDVRLLVLDENLGFAGGVDAGVRAGDGDWVLLVNNDAEVEGDAIALLLDAADGHADVGTVTGQVRFYDRREVINTAGLVVDRLGIGYDRLAGSPAQPAGPPEEVFGASGCVAMYRRAMLEQVGGFDPSFFAFQEDADVAWAARMHGWRCLYVPGSVAYHHGSATIGESSAWKYELVGRNRIRLLAKNATRSQLLAWGWAMLLYDLAYVVFVALTDRTLAPARGRLTGLREWPRYRAAGRSRRRPAPLAPPAGFLGALRMRSASRAGR